MPTLRVKFNMLLNEEKVLKNNSYTAAMSQSNYYQLREVFVKNLSAFIRDEPFNKLSGKEVTKLCSLVGSYRPMALHSFMIVCGQKLGEL